MAESSLCIPPASAIDKAITSSPIQFVSVNVEGRIDNQSYTTLYTYYLRFKPSCWILSYVSSYTGNSSANMLAYDTELHQAYYDGWQTGGTNLYGQLAETVFFIKGKYWRSGDSSLQTTTVSNLPVSAIFFK